MRFVLDRGSIERDAAGKAQVVRGVNIDLTGFPHLDKASLIAEGRISGGSEAPQASRGSGPVAQRGEATAGDAARLRASEERLQLAQDAAGIGAWDVDLQTGVAVWSARMYDLLGLAPNPQPSSRLFLDHVHPEDVDRLRAAVDAAVAARSPFREEFRILRADGAVRHLVGAGRVVGEVHGAPARMIGVNYDVTERIETQEALRASEALLRAVLSSTPDLVWAKDREGRMTLANEATLDLLGGGDPARVLGRDSQALIPDRAQARAIAENDARVLERGESILVEERVTTEGGVRLYQSFKSPLRDPQGAIVGVVGVSRDVTSQKRAEAALRASEERHRTLVRATSAVTWVCPPSGLQVEPQREWMEFTGQTADEMLGEGWNRAVHPDDAPAAAQAWREAVAQEAPFRGEFRLRRHDGQWRWMRVEAAPIRNPEGEAILWFGMNVDITERKEAEVALRQSEARLRHAAEAARFGVYDFDPRRQAGVWSTPLHEIAGVSPDGPISLDDTLATAHPDDRERLRAELAAIERRVGPYELEFRILRPDGAVRWVIDRGEAVGPLDVDTGLVARVSGTVLDITARKQAEDALRAAHDTFRQLVERSPFGVYAVDADFRLAQVSDGAQKVFASVRPLIGRDFAEVLRIIWPEPFATKAIERFRHTLATGEPFRAPALVERRADTGATESYDWKIERIVMPDGRPGVVCNFYDLSERQRHEEHVRLLLREVNHRSKNMLSVVQTIARQTASSGVRDFLDRFDERIEALSVAQDLLVRNEWGPVPMAELVRSQLSHFAELLDRRISLEGPPLALVPDTAQAFAMTLHELATNAAKYGALSNGTGRVEIAWDVRRDEGAGPRFILSWTEHGGPPVAQPARRGFGVTVTTRLIASSTGGEVSTDYAPEGFAWRLTCPVERVLQTRAPSATPRPTSAERAAPSIADAVPAAARRRVLVVEDDPLIADEIAAALAEAGFDVIGPAGDLETAFDALAGRGCDAAVLDVKLGDGTTESLARLLTDLGAPFVVVSGYARDQLPEAFRHAPLLGKPLRLPVLTALLSDRLSGAAV